MLRVWQRYQGKPRVKPNEEGAQVSVRLDSLGRLHSEAVGVRIGDAVALLAKRGRKIPEELRHLLPDSTPAPNMPARGGSARTRHDDMQIEIDDVRAGLEQRGEPATPAKVMAMLKARAGRPDSCISETAPDGVIWTRGSSGEPEKLSADNLKSRLSRRKSR